MTAAPPPSDIFYCVTDTVDEAAVIIAALEGGGFARDQLSLLIPDGQGNRHLPHDDESRSHIEVMSDSARSGLIGGALGLYVGAILLLIPGLALVAIGPLALLLSSAAAGTAAGTVLGGLTAALMKAGMPDAEATRHEAAVRAGKVLLIVHTEGAAAYRRAQDLIIGSGLGEISLSSRHIA